MIEENFRGLLKREQEYLAYLRSLRRNFGCQMRYLGESIGIQTEPPLREAINVRMKAKQKLYPKALDILNQPMLEVKDSIMTSLKSLPNKTNLQNKFNHFELGYEENSINNSCNIVNLDSRTITTNLINSYTAKNSVPPAFTSEKSMNLLSSTAGMGTNSNNLLIKANTNNYFGLKQVVADKNSLPFSLLKEKKPHPPPKNNNSNGNKNKNEVRQYQLSKQKTLLAQEFY